ncbi:unnamed protein product [Mycena citricolor]|uniref:Efficient mitochondria targeting-associated protein 19 n=1 Tax=Mycena citricolor TaxID=2018698 RepID=A0AAD2H1Z7_9AGAR|nr:unnamed protein product [Mycena citricolor]CAK5283207.1 unnamed protein product [Mycena citricolor]
MARKPLTSRPLDLVYFAFFVTHIFASLFMDFQPLYPSALVPGPVRQFAEWYIKTSGDPLMKVMFGSESLVWFKSFIFLEVTFQFPTFFIAARSLWNDSKNNCVLMLVYAASTTTTVWPCVTTILATPGPSAAALAAGVTTLTFEQRTMLLSSYVPFLLVPLVMTVDMALRLQRLSSEAIATREAMKAK